MIADLGLMDLIKGGTNRQAALLEVRLRAYREMGVTAAVVPPRFPLETAEYLRAGGVALAVDRSLFAERRRAKAPAEQRHRWRRAVQTSRQLLARDAEAGLRAQLQDERQKCRSSTISIILSVRVS
jgi:Xaa-Pro aminopeptidase